jgi:glycosyltransferase involved in cell wall biosynthesis
MRIGFDAKRAYHNNTGLGNYSRDLIQGMANSYKDDDYFLFTPSLSENPRIAFTNYFPNVNAVIPQSTLDRQFKSYWRSVNLEKDLIKNGIELYHGLSQEIPKRKGGKVKYVVTIHDLIFLRFPETYKAIDRKIYDKKFRYATENADLVIAISEQTKSDLIEFYDADPDKIRVVYQSCHDQFKQELTADSKTKIIEKHKLPSDYILYVGTIEKRKNLVSLIKACANINMPIVAIGNQTDYFNEVKKVVAANGMEKQVHFLQDIPFTDLPAIYQSAKLFCYPSVFEGFGIPIIEALYSKIPVITSKGGVFSETGGPSSTYIDPLDIDQLSSAIEKTLSTNNSEQIAEGYKFVQKFSTENHIKGIRNVYKELF